MHDWAVCTTATTARPDPRRLPLAHLVGRGSDLRSLTIIINNKGAESPDSALGAHRLTASRIGELPSVCPSRGISYFGELQLVLCQFECPDPITFEKAC